MRKPDPGQSLNNYELLTECGKLSSAPVSNPFFSRLGVRRHLHTRGSSRDGKCALCQPLILSAPPAVFYQSLSNAHLQPDLPLWQGFATRINTLGAVATGGPAPVGSPRNATGIGHQSEADGAKAVGTTAKLPFASGRLRCCGGKASRRARRAPAASSAKSCTNQCAAPGAAAQHSSA